MDKKDKIVYAAAGIIAAIACIMALIYFVKPKDEPEPPKAAVSESKEDEPKIKIIQIEKEITAEMIEEKLEDMGFLVTQEYIFTELVTYTADKKIFDMIKVPFTHSEFAASYDGVITAGMDFTKITVTKDADAKKVILELPAAEIKNVDVDPESFTLHTEKEGIGNPISIKDYNNALIELEKKAKERALDHGILDKANENGKRMISNFVAGMMDSGDYRVEFR